MDRSGSWLSRLMPWGAASRRFHIETPPLPRAPRLEVTALGSSVEVTQAGGPGGALVVEGRGSARVEVAERPDGSLVARVRVANGGASIRGPLESLRLDATGASVRLEAGQPLSGLELGLRGSSLAASAALKPGARLAVRALASAASIRLGPLDPGEYFVEVDASAASLRIEAPRGAAYIIQGAKPPTLTVERGAASPREAPYRIHVRTRLWGAALKLA